MYRYTLTKLTVKVRNAKSLFMEKMKEMSKPVLKKSLLRGLRFLSIIPSLIMSTVTR